MVLGLCLASMVVYAFRGRKRDADQEGKGAQLFLGFGDFLLHWFMWAIGPTVRVSLRLGLTPDPDFDSIIRMHLAESRPGG